MHYTLSIFDTFALHEVNNEYEILIFVYNKCRLPMTCNVRIKEVAQYFLLLQYVIIITSNVKN